MKRVFRCLPTRRTELLIGLLLNIGCLGLVTYLHHQNRFSPDSPRLLVMVTLEIILPLTAGLWAAGLLAGDPMLDILVSAHRPAWRTLLERLLVVGLLGALIGSTTLVLTAYWNLRLPKHGSAQIFIWLSPMAFSMGLASVVALLRGRMLDGALAALSVMGISVMMLNQIPRLCAGTGSGEPCLAWLLSPIMTLGNPDDAYWPLNRLLWLFVGGILLRLSLGLTHREETLLSAMAQEQD
jgi:hypothetical protein